MAPDRQAQQVIGYVFLGLMVVFVILGVTTFNGTPTVMLIIGALVFLAVSLTLLTGTGIGVGGGGGGGSSQQQSVVLSGGRVITQGGGIQAVCGSCRARMPDGARFCPDCGAGAWMNRGLTIAGAVLLALSVVIPLAMLGTMNGGFEEVIFAFIVVIPLAILGGLLGMILLIIGLATGGRGQQQQQQVVVMTGGGYCTACGQGKGSGSFCPACGVGA